MSKLSKIGVMQGRLSPIINGRIQSFPIETWQDEIKIAAQNDFQLMEWTIDYNHFYENPLLSQPEKEKIKGLISKYKLQIPSLTCDFMMERPLWKMRNQEKISKLIDDFLQVCEASVEIGIKILVIPLVDNGSLESEVEIFNLHNFLSLQSSFLIKKGIRIAFESDYEPHELKKLIIKFDPNIYGINYDIGNSASLGFDVEKEFFSYGDRIINVHVKDRVLKGGTISFGQGNADFEKVFLGLNKLRYSGNYILQGARASNGDHLGEINIQRNFVENSFCKIGLKDHA